MKFMFDNFEEYAAIMGLTPENCNWNAYKILWTMARTPEVSVDSSGKLVVKKKKAKK